VDEIGHVVRTEPDMAAVCERLIRMANEAGGPDNITVIAARFEGAGLHGVTGGDEVAHRVFQLETEGRATLQVNALEEFASEPTLEVIPAARDAVPDVPAYSGNAAAPEWRGPGLATLRIVFIVFGIVLAGVFVAAWLRK
jgi:hypothetical protein